MSEGLRLLGARLGDAFSTLYHLTVKSYAKFARVRDSDPRFAFGAFILMLYIIIDYTRDYQDASVEAWNNITLGIVSFVWVMIYFIYWVIPVKNEQKANHERRRNGIKNAVHAFTGIIIMTTCIFYGLQFLIPSIAVFSNFSFFFAVVSSVGLISSNLFAVNYNRTDWTIFIRRIRGKAISGNACTIYPILFSGDGSLRWKTTSDISADILSVKTDNNLGGIAQPLDQYDISNCGFYFKSINSTTNRRYFSPATESQMVKERILNTFESHLPQVRDGIEKISLSHLLLATISSFRNRWGRYSISALTKGIVSFPLDSGRTYISHTWERNEIAKSARYIRNQLIHESTENPVSKWFTHMTNQSINDQLLCRYISLLTNYDSSSKDFGQDKWDATIEGFTLVCNIAETEQSPNYTEGDNNPASPSDFVIKNQLYFCRRNDSGLSYEQIFRQSSLVESEVFNSPVEEFVKLHDDILSIALSNLENRQERLLEFIEKVIRRMMEKIHQTKHLEGRKHRKEQLIDRRHGIIAGTVLGLNAVYPSLMEVKN